MADPTVTVHATLEPIGPATHLTLTDATVEAVVAPPERKERTVVVADAETDETRGRRIAKIVDSLGP